MSLRLRIELADVEAWAAEFHVNLRHGRALVPVVVDAEPLSAAELELVRLSDGAHMRVDAKVVMLLTEGPVRGTALELVLDDGSRERLVDFVAGGMGEVVPTPLDESDASGVGPLHALDALPLLDELPSLDSEPPPDGAQPTDAEDLVGELVDSERPSQAPAAAHDPKIIRLRKLNAVERNRLARDGGLEDRVLLERMYGKAVWEDLLRNPQLTVPEVARIANKGTAPRVMLEQIVENAAWARQSIVRRALLGNPRLSNDGVMKLLRQTPKNELKLVIQGTAYPVAVRSLAKKLLDE